MKSTSLGLELFPPAGANGRRDARPRDDRSDEGLEILGATIEESTARLGESAYAVLG